MRAVRPTWGWGMASVILVTATVLCTVLATIIVDALLIRPMPASVNTLLPGWTYGAVAVLKICLVAGVAAAIVVVVNGVRRRWGPGFAVATTAGSAGTVEGAATHAKASEQKVATLAMLSVVLPSVTPLVGALGVVTTQALMSTSGSVSLSDVQHISRSGVIVMAVWLTVGLGVGGLAILRRECPRTLSMLGVTTNACLIAVFWYCQFWVLEFDQDRWAGS